MATKEDQEVLRLLVQHVARGFYEPKFVIILDQLARYPVLKDDDLAGKMGLQPKELNKIIAVLANDSLVKVYRQNELKEGAQRSVGRQYYYIDYEHFCNVVKWRVAKMRQKIDSTLRNELDNKGYICPQCKHAYSPLDVDKLMDFTRGCLVCEICKAEVIDNENAENVVGSKDRMQRFNHQMRFIREGLQKSEAMVLPSFDVAGWVKSNTTESDKSKAVQSNGGVKIAGSDPSKKVDEGIGVLISMDKDEATQKQERDALAEAKRQQNALPSWHLKSTITGDLTALGVKEHARAEGAISSSSAAAAASQDELLRGLGVSGGGKLGGQSQAQTNGFASTSVVEDVKPTINHEADYYDQYYASLAASATVSTQPTPTATGLSAQGSSDFGDLAYEEEEDKKPSIEYLDSLNEYRKRSRSREDDGQAAKKKQVKVENGSGAGAGLYGASGYDLGPGMNGYTMDGGIEGLPDGAVAVDDMQPPAADDDPLVYVNGTPKSYSLITEEDHDLMTPEEYTAYFEVVQARS
ncbi:hypothetical protein AX16_004797 [Volvariella volvacea WC 439]|nr:hypothetical protein AX16_004797 [Volvariella volvacea WC 439]